MMASLSWDEGQRKWVQRSPGSCLEAVQARRKARPLLPNLASGSLHPSSSEIDALLPDLQLERETLQHHQGNLQEIQVGLQAVGRPSHQHRCITRAPSELFIWPFISKA